jgi:hypothetical protein
MIYFSELNQDLNIITFFNNKYEQFFIDIGANDGKTSSNTYLLEKKYNWSGICSEPLPQAFKQLCKCRSVYCDENAVFLKNGHIYWKHLGKGKLFHTHIDYNNGNIWYRDQT